jgi:transcriptional regulator with XRE-family HTH domain
MPKRKTQRTETPFADALPHLLAERGLTARALAKAAGVSPSHLSRALRGADYKRPGPRLVGNVAEALGLPRDYFPEYRTAVVVAQVHDDPQLRERLYARAPKRTL